MFDMAKKLAPNAFVVVDNCYGEFTRPHEPAYYGADVMIGSLIKNIGSGIAPTGGYIAGSKKALERIEMRLTVPGMGREVGSYYGSYITSSKAEQAMTSAIMNVTSETQVKAAVLSGHGEQSPDGLTALMEDNNFEIVTVSPATEEIPSDVDVLIWMAPTNDPDQERQCRLDIRFKIYNEK